MEIYTEEEAEDFLEKRGFKVVKRAFIKDEEELADCISKFEFPIVMKISGKTIIHKNKLGGVKTNIGNYEEALMAFRDLNKIKGFEGAVIQKQVVGSEFLLGIKKTSEFNHVIAFGAGGTKTEELKDVSFRVCPFDKKDALEMIEEVKMAENLDIKSQKIIVKNLINLCKLIKKNSEIKELDINPLTLCDNESFVIDARIVFG